MGYVHRRNTQLHAPNVYVTHVQGLQDVLTTHGHQRRARSHTKELLGRIKRKACELVL